MQLQVVHVHTHVHVHAHVTGWRHTSTCIHRKKVSILLVSARFLSPSPTSRQESPCARHMYVHLHVQMYMHLEVLTHMLWLLKLQCWKCRRNLMIIKAKCAEQTSVCELSFTWQCVMIRLHPKLPPLKLEKHVRVRVHCIHVFTQCFL